MKRIALIIAITLGIITKAYGLDAPHNQTNDIGCYDCHLNGQALVDQQTCLSCHNNVIAPQVQTHSGSKYYPFEKNCKDCHYVHFKEQHYVWKAQSFLLRGTISSITDNLDGTVTFGYTGLIVYDANWSDPNTWGSKSGSGRGLILLPNLYDTSFGFEIISGTKNGTSGTIIAKGSTAPFGTKLAVGKPFAITYGQAINAYINNPTTSPNVKFFSNQGVNGFAHADNPPNDNTPTGVCQVCHTQTQDWLKDGSKALALPIHAGQNGSRCTNCHSHDNGFRAACTSCHGYPPVVATLGGPDGLAENEGGTGSDSAGAHQVHATSDGLNYSCENCHSGGMPASPVYDKLIQIGFNMFNTYQSGTYNGRLSLANGYDYQPGNAGTIINKTGARSCTNIYCHSNVQNPANGTGGPTAYGTPVWVDPNSVQCGSCHNADGVQGNQTLMDSGSHTRHVASPYSKPCSECHNGAGSGTAVHVNNNINMAFVSDPHGNTGSYSQSPNIPGGGYGTCSNIYCHSIVQTDGGGSLIAENISHYKTPAWGSNVACGQCHHVPPFTGTHVTHAVSYSIDCSVCHSGAGYNGGTATPQHVNKIIEVAFDANFGGSYSQMPNNIPGNGYGSCSNVYCHSDVQADGGNAGPQHYRTPVWGGTINCDDCHGTALHTTGQPATGSHETHVATNNLSCNECHNNLGSGTTLHANKLIDMSFRRGGTYSQGTHTPGSGGYGTCSSTYCHGIGTPTWGAAGSVLCGSCHAVNNSLAANHPAHWSVNTNATSSDRTIAQNKSTSTNYIFSCAVCHYNVSHGGGPVGGGQAAFVSFDPSIASGGTYTPGGTSQNDPNGFSYTNGSCSSTYCHSNGIGGAPNTTPTWGATLTCKGCHNYTVAGGSPMATGSHTAHVNATVIGNLGCDICHNATTIDGSTIYDKTRHVNHAKDVVLNNTYGGSYSGGACSNNYCHSNATALNTPYPAPNETLVWGTGNATCSSCHDGTTTGPSYTNGSPKANSHNTHVVQKGYNCYTCHSGTVDASNNISNPAYHMNKQYNVSGTYIGSYTYDPTGGTCSNVYCHSSAQSADGQNATPYQYGTPKWGDPASAVCGTCHPTTTIFTGSHTKHLNSGAGCGDCHTGAANDGSSYPSANHQNLLIDVAHNYTSGGAPGNGYGQCISVTCHNDGTAIWSGGTGSGNTPVWGTTAGCNACHGNTTYTNYRKAAPLYTSGSPKPNAHVYHVDVTDTSTDGSTGTGTQCKHCHNATTTNNISVITPPHLNNAYTIAAGSTYLDGDNVGGTPVTVTVNYSFTVNTISTCSNVSCHPTGLAGSKAASVTKWSNTYSCTDCHNINMNNTTAYHHVMDSTAMADRTYPTTAPGSSATDPNRKCTMCHVDHDIFSPKMNASSSGRSYNLRTAIGTTPTKTSGYTNSDYISGGGICISCHTNQLTKNTTNQKNDGTTVTMVVTDAGYSGSAHQYNVPSTMSNGGATFNANCVKCHNSKSNETTTFQGSTNKFGAHDNPLRRLLASLGMTSPTDPEEEDFCYRCHHKTTDTNPGGGPAKTTAGRDYYNAVAMSTKSEGIYNIMAATTTVSTNTLYFRNFSTSEPMPNANLLNSGTYTDNTHRIREMNNTQGSSPESYTANTTNGSGVRYFRVAQFLSPAIATGFTWNAGTTLTLTMRNVENNANNNCNLRWAMYKWNANDTLGTQFENVTDGGEFPTTVANTNYTITTDTAVTFNPGDKILIEIEIRANSPTNTGTCTVYWGGATENSRLSWTGNQNFSVPLKPFMHNVAAYSGIHKPTVTDETRTYLSANKHVECNDCHNPHEAKPGTNSGTQTNVASNALMGAPAVNPTWGGFWTAATGFTEGKISSTGTFIYEYQICFRCHSSYNQNLSTWNSGWTPVDQEFNPNNVGNYAGSWASGETAGSFHPVAAAATNNLGRTQNIISPWTTSSVMMCSDCHASDSTTDPNGPHGSAASFILKGPNTLWNASLTSNANNVWMPSGTFCLNCHNNSASSGRFPGHSRNNHAIPCFNCHSAIPHGGPRPGFLVANAGADAAVGGQIASWDTNPKYYQGQTTNRLYLKTYPANNTTSWAQSNCGCNGTGH